MTVNEAINWFREVNGCQRVDNWNRVVSDYCLAHCWAMASKESFYHAEPCYLGEWCEAIAMCGYGGNWDETLKYVIFDLLGSSPEHRNILLSSSEMASAVIMFKGCIYLTIRGK